MPAAELGRLAAGLAVHLDRWPRRRVRLTELELLLLRVAPELGTTTTMRAQLAGALEELQGAGIVTCSVGQDRFQDPPIPQFVTRVSAASGTSTRPLSGVKPQLGWASRVPLSASQREDVLAVNRWLRDRPAQAEGVTVPMRERSLEIFGDEKRLEVLLGGALFEHGRLSLELLDCQRVHPPFIHERLGDGPVLLVVENHDTYFSLQGALRENAGPIGVLGWGAGRLFERTVSYALQLPGRVERIRYFGDLDPVGVDIAVAASARAQRHGLPPVTPSRWLYEQLLHVGKPTPMAGGMAECSPQAAIWLPPAVAAAAGMLWPDGRRLAQEAVGARLLATQLRDPAMLDT
jgi:hypothetical protein